MQSNNHFSLCSLSLSPFLQADVPGSEGAPARPGPRENLRRVPRHGSRRHPPLPLRVPQVGPQFQATLVSHLYRAKASPLYLRYLYTYTPPQGLGSHLSLVWLLSRAL